MKYYVYVDFDGTLASGPYVDRWTAGAPIPEMVARVKAVLAHGKYGIKIFSARFSTPSEIELSAQMRTVRCFLHAQFGLAAGAMELTATKGMDAVEFWDDLATGVAENEGRMLSRSRVCDEIGIK